MKNYGMNWKNGCEKCPRLVASRTQIVYPVPCPPGGLLVIGEAPGADEDEIGEGFVGQAGRTLDALLVRHGLERNRDYGVANIVRCRPEGNRKPTREEVANCLPHLAAFLVEARPKMLLLVGSTAVEVFLGPGPLLWHIERSRNSPVLLAKDAHPILQPAIRRLHDAVACLMAVPMPHTSGMAWNRKAPSGKKWREIGEEQVLMAAEWLELVRVS
ncbi:hypothetical protein Hthe01_18620 [Hydrogenophilus thermoluteolus]|uniref:uracil-DNA glycosylase n=1 Tax=Hydrogenophilus thermoluteolus TaxID=297 RepID=UPI0024A53737|nr:uracil-DNA glycosylase [Hydrogenophilus thermoluteolus]GLW61513.1 hypothetical protein Hthe01_18620 [Hydrogenophilus thermoluteolus]